jgi:crotonobetainyl-CoA:carnitine CoA-transferase CaiB-like acyl-CoA transferase
VRILEIARRWRFPSRACWPTGADIIRSNRPPGRHPAHDGTILPGESKGFTLVNRGKRAICLDITREECRPVLERLVRWADVVMVSMKPADLPRYRIAYEDFKALNPSVVYLEHVPLGKHGPLGGEPGYDVVVQGLSGTAVLTARERDGVPMNIRPAFNDMGTGAFSALGVVAALRPGSHGRTAHQTSLLGNDV